MFLYFLGDGAEPVGAVWVVVSEFGEDDGSVEWVGVVELLDGVGEELYSVGRVWGGIVYRFEKCVDVRWIEPVL